MTDSRDFGRRVDTGPMEMDRPLEMERRMGAPTPWGWLAGAVFVIVMLALLFISSEGTRTANNETIPPAATAPATVPPAITVPPAETTGQGGQRGQ